MKKITSIFMIFIIIITILNVISLPIKLRFQETSLNYLTVMILSILLPLSIFIKALFSKEKTPLVIIALGICIPSFIVFTFARWDYHHIRKNGVDESFKVIQEISRNQQYYRLYLTNGGATTAYGLILRKEVNLLFGLKLVFPIFDKYKAQNGTLEFISSDKLKIEIQPYSKGDKIYIREIEI